MLLARGTSRTLGVASGARLRFAEADKPEGSWAGRRQLLLDERPAFELSYWCGTCGLLFQRLEGAVQTLSLSALSDRLADGLDEVDEDVVDTFGALLPAGAYLPLLLEIAPRLVLPAGAGDYFSGEQVATWGIDAFWGLPENPHTPYYRTWESRVAPDAHLYEFVVGMVPPGWNEPAVVAAHAEALRTSSRPTAVAVSTLDVCAPAVAEEGTDWHWHWGLTHFLLDGHHKLQAAAQAGLPLRLLALVSLDGSLASADELARLPDLRRGARAARI